MNALNEVTVLGDVGEYTMQNQTAGISDPANGGGCDNSSHTYNVAHC